MLKSKLRANCSDMSSRAVSRL